MSGKKFIHSFEKSDETSLRRVSEKEAREEYIFARKMKR
jgi:hypothetical protein